MCILNIFNLFPTLKLLIFYWTMFVLPAVSCIIVLLDSYTKAACSYSLLPLFLFFHETQIKHEHNCVCSNVSYKQFKDSYHCSSFKHFKYVFSTKSNAKCFIFLGLYLINFTVPVPYSQHFSDSYISYKKALTWTLSDIQYAWTHAEPGPPGKVVLTQ